MICAYQSLFLGKINVVEASFSENLRGLAVVLSSSGAGFWTSFFFKYHFSVVVFLFAFFWAFHFLFGSKRLLKCLFLPSFLYKFIRDKVIYAKMCYFHPWWNRFSWYFAASLSQPWLCGCCAGCFPQPADLSSIVLPFGSCQFKRSTEVLSFNW